MARMADLLERKGRQSPRRSSRLAPGRIPRALVDTATHRQYIPRRPQQILVAESPSQPLQRALRGGKPQQSRKKESRLAGKTSSSKMKISALIEAVPARPFPYSLPIDMRIRQSSVEDCIEVSQPSISRVNDEFGDAWLIRPDDLASSEVSDTAGHCQNLREDSHRPELALRDMWDLSQLQNHDMSSSPPSPRPHTYYLRHRKNRRRWASMSQPLSMPSFGEATSSTSNAANCTGSMDPSRPHASLQSDARLSSLTALPTPIPALAESEDEGREGWSMDRRWGAFSEDTMFGSIRDRFVSKGPFMDDAYRFPGTARPATLSSTSSALSELAASVPDGEINLLEDPIYQPEHIMSSSSARRSTEVGESVESREQTPFLDHGAEQKEQKLRGSQSSGWGKEVDGLLSNGLLSDGPLRDFDGLFQDLASSRGRTLRSRHPRFGFDGRRSLVNDARHRLGLEDTRASNTPAKTLKLQEQPHPTLGSHTPSPSSGCVRHSSQTTRHATGSVSARPSLIAALSVSTVALERLPHNGDQPYPNPVTVSTPDHQRPRSVKGTHTFRPGSAPFQSLHSLHLSSSFSPALHPLTVNLSFSYLYPTHRSLFIVKAFTDALRLLVNRLAEGVRGLSLIGSLRRPSIHLALSARSRLFTPAVSFYITFPFHPYF